MTVIRYNHCDPSVTTTDPSYQNITATSGVLVADSTDITGANTGISVTLTSTDPLNLSTSNQGVVEISPFIKEACDYYQFGFGESSRNIILVYAGFAANESVDVSFVGFRASLTRSVTLTVNGNSYTYNNNGSTTSPTPALTFTETANTSGLLTITFTSPTLEVFYLSALQLSYGSEPKITVSDPITDGDTAIPYSRENMSTITGVTVDGVPVSFTQTAFDNFDVATQSSDAGTIGPKIGNVLVEVTDGTGTASVTVANDPKAGEEVTNIVTVDTSKGLYLRMQEDVGLTLASSDQILMNTTDLSYISDDGNYSFASLPKDFYYYENLSGKWYGLRMNKTGQVEFGGITATNLSASELTATKLRATKL